LTGGNVVIVDNNNNNNNNTISSPDWGRGQQTLFQILFMLDFCASMTFELPCLWLPVFTRTPHIYALYTHTHSHTLLSHTHVFFCCISTYATGKTHICCHKLQADAFLSTEIFFKNESNNFNFVATSLKILLII